MNKNNKKTEYLEKLKDMKLSDSSHDRIKKNLLEYARFHSVRVGGEGRSIEQVQRRTSLFTLFKQPKSMTAGIIAIALIAGGGTSYAAEGAVPGDALYVVKTEVNENIKSAFAISNEAEARLQTRLAEERLEEAEELAARGELTAEVSADINARLKAHYDEAESRGDTAEANGDYETSATVRASLEGAFRTHADILSDLNTRVLGNEGTLLITNIRGYADTAAKAQLNATATIEASVSAKAATEATIKRADSIIADVEAKVARAKTKVSADAHARVEAKLAEAVSAQAEAKASFRAEAYRAAYTSVQAAIRIANETDAMVQSMLRIEIDGVLDVRTNVDERTNTETRTHTESDTGADSDVDRDVDSSVNVDVTTDSRVDTDVIDASVKTDASARSGLNL